MYRDLLFYCSCVQKVKQSCTEIDTAALNVAVSFTNPYAPLLYIKSNFMNKNQKYCIILVPLQNYLLKFSKHVRFTADARLVHQTYTHQLHKG